LSEDFSFSIEYNSPEATEEWVQFIPSYNQEQTAFDRLASEPSATIQLYINVSLWAEQQMALNDSEWHSQAETQVVPLETLRRWEL
jgi:hypothetical protein